METHAFVIETPEDQMKHVMETVSRRAYNYLVVKPMPFGLFLASLDGNALVIPEGEAIPSFTVIRRPTDAEAKQVCEELNEKAL